MKIPRCLEITYGECLGCPMCNGLNENAKRMIRIYYRNLATRMSEQNQAENTTATVPEEHAEREDLSQKYIELLARLDKVTYEGDSNNSSYTNECSCPWIRVKNCVTEDPWGFFGGVFLGFSGAYGLYRAGDYAYQAYMNRS